MTQYSIEPRTRKYGYGFLLFARKYKKQLFNTGLDCLKAASKKVVHKIADTVTNSSNNKTVKTKPLEEIIILPEKREKY